MDLHTLSGKATNVGAANSAVVKNSRSFQCGQNHSEKKSSK